MEVRVPMEMNMGKFSEKLVGLLELAKKKKNVLEYQEISDYFKDQPLDAEQMEGMVGKYRNPEYLPIDPDCNADHIPNTVIITKRVYDILCNGVGIFDDTAVCTAHDRGDPLQNSVCHLYRL